ncbi:MAG: hypothetical protein GY853_10385 [PVC group bacterium]|nr:hypothetical protein [PVC group bacterium]
MTDNYTIIDSLPDDYQLQDAPMNFWLIISLEVVVGDENGPSLLLTYPSYNLNGHKPGLINEGYWAPPFLAYNLIKKYSYPNRIGSIKELYSNFEKKLNVDDAIGELTYLMGLPDPAIKHAGSFTEVKRSPRTPEHVKCYKIIRYSCTNLGEKGKRNLADPEFRKGHVFLPLENLDNVLLEKYSDSHKRPENWFLSKPLISNVDAILSSPQNIESLKSKQIKLSDKDFVREERGILFKMDLAGYGTACKYAIENMHTFEEKGENIATSFRKSISVIFYEFLMQLGIMQVHLEGDGFIAALPNQHCYHEDIFDTISFIIKKYTELLRNIEHFNKFIKDDSKKVGSRLAIHFGDYTFGRVAKTMSLATDFDGASIIEVARLEGALSSIIKGSNQNTKSSGSKKTKKQNNNINLFHGCLHNLIISEDFHSKFGNGDLAKMDTLKFINQFKVKIKESTLNAYIYNLMIDIA